MKKLLIGLIITISIFSILLLTGYIFIKSSQSSQNTIGDIASSTNSSKPEDSQTSSGQNNNEASNTNDTSTVEGSASDSITSSENTNSKVTSNNSETKSELTSTQSNAEIVKREQQEKKNESIVDKVLPDKVEDKVNAIAQGDVSSTDLLEVIKIVGGKLGVGEISFLFSSAKAEYWETTSVEDIEKARAILFSKLSDSDLAALTSFGKKYGRSMDILKKDLDVSSTKEAQMRAKGLID